MDRADNISLRFEDYKNNSYLTHNYHPYPAKFVPQIPSELIQTLSEPGDWVLDPFVGSGTTLVEANLAGRHALGVDVNPLSCLISRVKTTVLDSRECNHIAHVADRAAQEVRSGARHQPPKFFGIDKWFSPRSQQELAALLSVVRAAELVTSAREFLEVAFASIVVKASRQESDTRYKAIEKDIAPFKIADYFVARVQDMLKRMEQFRAMAKPSRCLVALVDSTKLIPGDIVFDLAVTSPPYMNSYDYYLYHKHRMSWLGFDYRGAQEAEFGSRNKHNDKNMGIDAYNDPIARNAALVFQRLKTGGRFCVVVGDAILKGEVVRMNSNFDALLSHIGFEKVREIVFPQRKYTKTFTPGLRDAFKNSYVLIYKKQ